MTLSDLKLLFRKGIKVVTGGPAVGTPGQNRAQGVLDALDALAEFAAGLGGQATFAGLTGQPTDNAALATALAQAASASQRTFALVSTSTNPYADLLADHDAARLTQYLGRFNSTGLKLQVITLAGAAYRPARVTLGELNADLDAFWLEFGSPAIAVLRFMIAPSSQAIVAHGELVFSAAPSSVPQFLQPHDSGFRPFGNQFTLAPPDWNHVNACTISGGNLQANAGFNNSFGTSSPSLSNTGSGLRIRVEFKHNGANDYALIGLTNSAAAQPSPNGSTFGPCFYLNGAGTIRAQLGSTTLVSAAYALEQLAIEVADTGITWYVGGVVLWHEPTPPTDASFWLGVLFYTQGSAWLDVKVGAQVTTPR